MTALPEVAFKKLTAVIGTPGAGKSYNVCEQIVVPKLKRREQVVIVDPTGAWFGVTLKPDGKTSSKYDIAVFGGDHGMQLTPNMGRAMGELLGTQALSAVLDLSRMELSEQISFMAEWAGAILLHNKKPITVVIDEADEFCPQVSMEKGTLSVCKGRVKRLITRGRKRGFRPVLITQRPQAVDKGAFNMVQVMIALQCSGHHERKQVEEYVKANGDPKAMSEMLESLSQLAVGEAWVWAPRDKILTRTKFGRLSVYDSFREEDEEGGFDGTIPVSSANLDVITKSLAEFEAQRKANDPVALRKQVAELQKQVKSKPTLAPVQDTTNERSIAYNAGWAAAMKDTAKERAAVRKRFESVQALLGKAVALFADGEMPIAAAPAPPKEHKIITGMREAISHARRSVPVAPAEGITRPQQKVLDALAWWAAAGHEQPTREQVAGVAGYSPSSGGFNNLIGGLGTSGWVMIPSPGTVALTDVGAQIGRCDDTPTVDDLHRRVQGILTNPQWKLMAALIERHPDAMTRDDLAEATEYSASSGGFNNLIGSLSTLKMIEKPQAGYVRAADWLFEVR